MTRPIRILLIAPSTRFVGGQAVQAKQLIDHLAGDPAVDVTFLPMDPRWPAPFAFLHSVKLVRTLVMVASFVTLLLFKGAKYDVYHVFAAAYYSFMWAPAPTLLIAKLFRKPCVLNYHDGRAEGHLREWRSAVPLVSLADEIVTPSAHLCDVFKQHSLRAAHIPNIVDNDRLIYRPRRCLKPVFLHNRGMEDLYNVPCILRAFQRVQRIYPNAEMLVAHDGPLRRRLEQQCVEMGLRNVKFVGNVPQEKIGELYDAADIYWMAPNIDCMPLSILEAFAAGLPLIATNVGGIPYIVEHGRTGLLSAPDDDESIANNALLLLADSSLADRLAKNARAELAKYDWGVIGPQWLDLYRRLAGAEVGDLPAPDVSLEAPRIGD